MSLIDHVPERYRHGARKAADSLKTLDYVLIATHINPDGDAIGSMAATGFIMQHLGRRFALYAPGGVPSYLRFLELPAEPCATLSELPFMPESAIYVDLSDRARLGPELASADWPSVNIDHHICDHGLGSLDNFIEPGAAAACQLVGYVSMALDLALTHRLGQAVGTGLLTDTGYFSHGNTSADVFALAAILQQNGANLPQIWTRLKNTLSLNRLHLWGALFEKIRLDDQGRIASCCVTRADLGRYHCTNEDIEDFVEWLRKIRGVCVSALIREISPAPDDWQQKRGNHAGLCKFSLRSRDNVDVQQIAAQFGGGGHKNAAGGNINASPEAAQALLVSAIAEWLNSHCPVHAHSEDDSKNNTVPCQ